MANQLISSGKTRTLQLRVDRADKKNRKGLAQDVKLSSLALLFGREFTFQIYTGCIEKGLQLENIP